MVHDLIFIIIIIFVYYNKSIIANLNSSSIQN